jgi:hypothetical protein
MGTIWLFVKYFVFNPKRPWAYMIWAAILFAFNNAPIAAFHYHPSHYTPTVITLEAPNFEATAWVQKTGAQELMHYAGGGQWLLTPDHLCRTPVQNGLNSYFRIAPHKACGSGKLVFKAPPGSGSAHCPGTSWFDPKVGLWLRLIEDCSIQSAQFCPKSRADCPHGGWVIVRHHLSGRKFNAAEASIHRFYGGWGTFVASPLCKEHYTICPSGQ